MSAEAAVARTAGVVLSVAPHPDDELLGAPATLMALRDAGWRVVNLACSLGRDAQRESRREELVEACRRAGFELEIAEGLPPIGREDDLAAAQRALGTAIARTIEATDARLIIGPSPHDGHHGHEVVGRALRDAVEGGSEALGVLLWALWGELPLPNVIVPFDAPRLAEIQRALSAHTGELARNRFDRLLEARAISSAVLGPERVFGFGTPGIDAPYAELLTAATWTSDAGWRLAAPRELHPDAPIAAGDGPELGWWLHAPSARSELASRRR